MIRYGAVCPKCSTRLRVELQIDLEKTFVSCPNCSTQFFVVAPIASPSTGIREIDFLQDLPASYPAGQYANASMNQASIGSNLGVDRGSKWRKSWTGPIIGGVAVFIVGFIGIGILLIANGFKGPPKEVTQARVRERAIAAMEDRMNARRSAVRATSESTSLYEGTGGPFGGTMSPPNSGVGIPTFDSSFKDYEGPLGVRIHVTNAEAIDTKNVIEKLLKDLGIRGHRWSSSGGNLSIGLFYSGSLSEIEKRIQWGEIIESNSSQRLIRIKVNKP